MVILSLVNDGLMVITLAIGNGRAMAIGILATAMAIWYISVIGVAISLSCDHGRHLPTWSYNWPYVI